MTAHVVHWQYNDGSGSGVVSVHWTAGSAEAMLIVLQRHGDTSKVFSVVSCPCEALP